MSAIQAESLSKRFPKRAGYRDLLPLRTRQWVTAVRDVSIGIREGEFFGLLGPNGAGKTTLIKLLCCLVLPDAGTARICGQDILRDEREVKRLVGLVSAEERSFYWRLTGRENLRFYASLYHLGRRRADSRIEELLQMVGLAGHGDIRFQSYSTGMRQKLAIARGLLSHPRVLFVDEPTRSLDPVSAQGVRAFFKERVAADGTTIILATHNLAEAEQLCDRVAIMDRGRIRATGSVPELRSIFRHHDGCQLLVRRLPETALLELQATRGVLECRLGSRHNGMATLELRLSDGHEVLPRILQVVVGSGAEVCDCRLRETPLEDIFVSALGEGPREED